MALTLVAALTTAACGNDDKQGASPSPDRADQPIKIGYHSLRDIPEITLGFTQGVKYVNEKRGGVGGRPLDLTECLTDGSPETSIDCANRFVQGQMVVAVQGLDLGTEAMIDILKGAGIAEVGMSALGPQASKAVGDAFFFNSPLEALGTSALLALKQQGATKLRLFAPEGPPTRSMLDTIIKPAAKQLQIDADYIFYNYGAADWSSLIAAARSQGADGIGLPGASEPECTAMVAAATRARFTGKVLASACGQFITELGSAAAGTLVLSDAYLPGMPDVPADFQQRLDEYEAWMKSQGQAEALKGTYALYGFALAATLGEMLGTLDGELDAAAVKAALPKAKGKRWFGGDYNCDGSTWPGSTACSAEILAIEITKEGGRRVVSDGYLDLSAHKPKP